MPQPADLQHSQCPMEAQMIASEPVHMRMHVSFLDCLIAVGTIVNIATTHKLGEGYVII
jgi:hypothetical protein